MWKELSMSEVWDILIQEATPEQRKVISKPEFPTRRWNQITTKVSTSDKKALQKCQSLVEQKSRLRIDKENSAKFKMKLYKIEIYGEHN